MTACWQPVLSWRRTNWSKAGPSATRPRWSPATPEEVILDFALNPNPFMQGKQELTVAHRLILNCYTAKRLLLALTQTLERHEQTYGGVELNLMRRAQGGTQQQPPRPQQ